LTAARKIWLTALFLALGGLPLLAARLTPLQDWPNHLARVHILNAMLHGDAFWAQFYRIGSFRVPNVALDLGIMGLMRLGAGPEAAAQLFLGITYLAFVGGVCALAAALRSYDPGKVALAAMLFTGGALFWGLVDYLLGIGLALTVLAAWVFAAGHPGRRLIVAVAGTALLFYCHLVAAAVFVALLGCVGAAEGFAARPRRLGGLSALAGFAALIGLRALSPAGEEDLFSMVYAGGPTWAGMLRHKATMFGHALLGGGAATDAATVTVLLGAAVLLGVAARPRLSQVGVAAVLASLLLALLAPERIGTGSLLDFRLAMLPLLLAVATLRIGWRAAPWRHAGYASLAAGLGVHAVLLGSAWRSADGAFAAFDRLAAQFSPGGIVVMANGTALAKITFNQFWSPPLTSIETQAVTRHVFVPMIFANPTQQPLALLARFEGLNQPFDFSSGDAVAASRLRLMPICAAWPSVYVTVLYPQPWLRLALPPQAVLGSEPDFLLLDGCALDGAWAMQPQARAGT